MCGRMALWGWLLVCFLASAPLARAYEPLLLGDDERLLVLAPHPDDEVLAAGGVIQEALDLDVPVQICFFTLGENNEIAALFTRRHPAFRPGPEQAFGGQRHREALAAATQLGLQEEDIVFLGYPDPGTLDIWNHHWRTVPPYRSPVTRENTVPYDFALTPGSAFAGEDILDDLQEVIREFQPTHVLLPHPADQNTDHRALYFFARVALWELMTEGIRPQVLTCPVHLARWPEANGFQPQQPAEPPPFLAKDGQWWEYSLAPFQVSNKLAALRRYHSQFLPAQAYLELFVRKTELFHELADWSFSRGQGRREVPALDTAQYRPNLALFQTLAQTAGAWREIAQQTAAEQNALANAENMLGACALDGDGANLTLTFHTQRPIERPAELVVRLYGYRPDTPFGDMPKIKLRAGADGWLDVQDLDRKIAHEATVTAGPQNELILHVPYALLGNPEKLFITAKLMKGNLPIDGLPAMTLDLGDMPALALIPAAPAEPAAPPELPPAKPSKPTKPARPAKPAKPAPSPSPPPAVAPPTALAPRVSLPTKAVPANTEANEPVQW